MAAVYRGFTDRKELTVPSVPSLPVGTGLIQTILALLGLSLPALPVPVPVPG